MKMQMEGLKKQVAQQEELIDQLQPKKKGKDKKKKWKINPLKH